MYVDNQPLCDNLCQARYLGNFLLPKSFSFAASILKARSHGVLPIADSEEEVLLLLVPATLIYSIFSEHNLNSY